jgi:hypothetical protein
MISLCQSPARHSGVFGGRIGSPRVLPALHHQQRRGDMNGIIYLIGLIVVIMAILSFLGLH